MGGVWNMAAQRGYDLLLCYAGETDVGQLERQLESHKVDGVILARTMLHDECVQTLQRHNVPFVAIGRVDDDKVPQVDNDQVGATAEMTRLLLQLGIIQTPLTWLQSPETLMPVMILVALWSSFDVGFLSMLSGMLNVNKEIYEAAHLDGIRNRIQEIIYVTIPSIRPQMLFGAVMALVGTFNSAGLGVQLSGSNPTPQYAGSLIVNHVDDFGFIRYEMGYAAALSVVLLLIISLCSKLAYKLFGDN